MNVLNLHQLPHTALIFVRVLSVNRAGRSSVNRPKPARLF